jgi:hypothetical protein
MKGKREDKGGLKKDKKKKKLALKFGTIRIGR